MVSPERVYSGSIRVFSFVLIGLGLAILISALANGAGPLSVGTLMGIAFIAVGGGRLWVSKWMSQ